MCACVCAWSSPKLCLCGISLYSHGVMEQKVCWMKPQAMGKRGSGDNNTSVNVIFFGVPHIAFLACNLNIFVNTHVMQYEIKVG